MQVTLTNLGTEEVPVTSSQGDGFAALLQPGVAFTVDDDQLTVLTVGDNPSFMEDFKDAMEGIADTIVAIIKFWEERPAPKAGEDPFVRVRVVAGDNSIRVTSDDRNNDYEVVPGSTYDASAPNYVELRQLGV